MTLDFVHSKTALVTGAGAVDGIGFAIARHTGPVDVLVNIAGMGSLRSPQAQSLFTDLTEEEWDAGIAVSLKTAYLVTRSYLPAMVERGRARVDRDWSLNAG